jgi:hypothetical protein
MLDLLFLEIDIYNEKFLWYQKDTDTSDTLQYDTENAFELEDVELYNLGVWSFVSV